jgi:hypothetical protein
MHMRRHFPVVRWAAALFALLVLLQTPASHAQTRVNDRDMTQLMKNLKEDAKNFLSPFDSGLHKSSIRNTGQEKDAKELADQFAKQTDEMWKRFKSKKRADVELQIVIETAGKLDRLIYSHNFDSKTTTSWEIVRSTLQEVTNGYGIPQSGG